MIESVKKRVNGLMQKLYVGCGLVDITCVGNSLLNQQKL